MEVTSWGTVFICFDLPKLYIPDHLPLLASPFLTSLVSSLNPRVTQLQGCPITLPSSEGHQSITLFGAAGSIAPPCHSHSCLLLTSAYLSIMYTPHGNSRQRAVGRAVQSLCSILTVSFHIDSPPHLYPTYSNLTALQSSVPGLLLGPTQPSHLALGSSPNWATISCELLGEHLTCWSLRVIRRLNEGGTRKQKVPCPALPPLPHLSLPWSRLLTR